MGYIRYGQAPAGEEVSEHYEIRKGSRSEDGMRMEVLLSNHLGHTHPIGYFQWDGVRFSDQRDMLLEVFIKNEKQSWLAPGATMGVYWLQGCIARHELVHLNLDAHPKHPMVVIEL